jgi:hypothetical protein
VYKRGPKSPPFLWEKGAPANFKIPKILTEFSFGIGMVNTEKIPKGSYRNTESVCNSSVFVSPIHGYADTQKKVRSFILFAAVLSRIRFVKFCKIGVFLARIPGYTLENDHFLSAYSFFCIRSSNSPSTWNSYSRVFGVCEYADAKNCCFPRVIFNLRPT